jgi:mannosyltransferase OCH1-like enzyme
MNPEFTLPTKIPKIIFQTWETNTFSEDFQRIVDTWKHYHPDYEYRLMDSQERSEFIKTHFDTNVYNAYCKILPGAFKADLWRYCVLYIYGGFYVDIDTICMGNVDHLLREDTQFVSVIDLNIVLEQGTHNLANGFIGSIPKHPILKLCINRVVFNVENRIYPDSILDFSGPGLLGRCVNTYLQLCEVESFIGKHGFHRDIHFLHFEKDTEYMKDETGFIICQNKNGNPWIQKLYQHECSKVQGFITWWNTSKFISDETGSLHN